MKIVFTTSSATLDGTLEQRFGRAPGFLVFDSESKAVEYIDNQENLNASQGAGIQAAQTLVATGAQYLITGRCGPKAFKVLQSAGVKVLTADELPLTTCLEQFEQGGLAEQIGASSATHGS